MTESRATLGSILISAAIMAALVVVGGSGGADPLPADYGYGYGYGYTFNFDVNEDGCIDVLDLILVGQHWKEGCIE